MRGLTHRDTLTFILAGNLVSQVIELITVLPCDVRFSRVVVLAAKPG